MEKYKIGATLGDGTFGVVMKAINQRTGQVVAIKKMKQKQCPKWEECVKLAEITSLMQLHHPNIVNLHEIIKHKNELFFVFEYMDQNVYQLTKDREKPFTETQVRNIIYQTLQGLAYIHRHGYFHRDLKPENLLEQNNTIKIADFGLARKIRSNPPFTDYVSTRWYRAPEVILRANNYNSPIDIFAIGCIMAELFKLWPLFPGQNELDQILQICKVLGTPTKDDWPEGYVLARAVGYAFPSYKPQNLAEVIPNASAEAIDLIYHMLRYSPSKRISATQALQHPFFLCHIPIPEAISINNIAHIIHDGEIIQDKTESYSSSSSHEVVTKKSNNNIVTTQLPAASGGIGLSSTKLKNVFASQSLDNLIEDLLQESKVIERKDVASALGGNQNDNQNNKPSRLLIKTGKCMRNAKFKPGVMCDLTSFTSS